jgi:hypothetical protein
LDVRKTLILGAALVALLIPLVAYAKPDPVQWTATLARRNADGTLVLSVAARIESPWYIYSMQQPENGPSPLRFRLAANAPATLGSITAPAPRVAYDRGFRMRVGKYYGNQVFTLPLRMMGSESVVPLEIRYQACNDTICLPPKTVRLQVGVAAAR